MESLSMKASEEREKLEKRKSQIDKELAEIEPMIQQAKSAVGNIKNETLGEIRALRAPPDTIRDILEGVLRVMGNPDTSWLAMKRFTNERYNLMRIYIYLYSPRRQQPSKNSNTQ